MKRKIYGFILLLTLAVLCAGCNKNKENNTSATEQTADATPTPTPANLAKVNLDKLPEQFDKLMSYQPPNTADLNKGIGYDFTLDVSLGEQIAELLDLTDLKNISAVGTIDTKDIMAANFDLCINEEKIMNAHLFTDSTNFLFNLPAYSANYAAMSWAEMLSSLTEETLTKGTVISDAEMAALLRKYLVELTECFVPSEISAENFSISNGDYLLAGKKHTARANINDVYAIMKGLETELANYYGEVSLGLEELGTEGATTLFLDYYFSENGDYAWAAYTDNSPKEQMIFIHTALGFCLYALNADGTTEVIMYSETTSENAGTVTLVSSEDEEALGTIDYEYSDTSFTMQAMIDTVVFTLEVSKINDTIRYDVTVIAEGISLDIRETIAPTYIDVSCSLASFGMEYLTMSVSADSRAYEEIPLPQNTVDLDTWTNELNQTALLTDVLTLLQKYPTLMNLFLGSQGGLSQDNTLNSDSSDSGSFDTAVTVPEKQPVDFTSLTGYSVTDGFVDFYPAEAEVLALGQPSTGMDTMQITEEQKNALMDYAKKSISNYKASTETFYWIWGSVEFQDIQSYYSRDYAFTDSKNQDNRITLSFDAVSGEFASVDIYHEDEAAALRIANDILALLDIDYTVTAEIAENYTFAKNLSFSGYDGAEYGGSYYNICFSVYYPEW